MILIIDTTLPRTRLTFDGRTIDAPSDKQSLDLPLRTAQILAGKQPRAIAVITGPGSFTGIRLGMAFAKGLALGYNVPIVGINVFETCAGADGKTILAIDSRRGDYFVCENGEYRIEQTMPAGAKLIECADLGRAIEITKEKLKKLQAGEIAPIIPLYIRPSYVEC